MATRTHAWHAGEVFGWSASFVAALIAGAQGGGGGGGGLVATVRALLTSPWVVASALGWLGIMLVPVSKGPPPGGVRQNGATQASPAPGDARGCPMPRPASANQPRVPCWPTTPGLVSIQVRTCGGGFRGAGEEATGQVRWAAGVRGVGQGLVGRACVRPEESRVGPA